MVFSIIVSVPNRWGRPKLASRKLYKDQEGLRRTYATKAQIPPHPNRQPNPELGAARDELKGLSSPRRLRREKACTGWKEPGSPSHHPKKSCRGKQLSPHQIW